MGEYAGLVQRSWARLSHGAAILVPALKGPGPASLNSGYGSTHRSINSGVPLGKGPGVFWQAGGRPAWTRAPRSGGSHRVMPEIHSPVRSLITPRMQDGVRGTSSRCGDGFAKQVARNVDKSEAPTFLRERIEIRLDENLDGLSAGINLDTNGRVAEIDLVSSSFRSANNGVGHCGQKLVRTDRGDHSPVLPPLMTRPDPRARGRNRLIIRRE